MEMMHWLLMGILSRLAVADPLGDSLLALQFYNKGDVKASDKYEWKPERGGYLECQNCTKAQYAWAENGPYINFLFKKNSTGQCIVGKIQEGKDMHGGDLIAFPMTQPDASPTLCGNYCCANVSCAAFVYSISPSDFGGCKKGDKCCYLKSHIGTISPSTASQIAVGIVNRSFDSWVPPPSGMRSSVPLGGLGAGSFEIRGDGSIHEWTIVNQSPAGAAKIPLLDDALFGLRINTPTFTQPVSRVLRTHPPQSATAAGAAGVEQMTYSGAFPVSRLQLKDNGIPVDASLFAYSSFHVADMEESAKPAVVFSIVVKNTLSTPVSVDFMFNFPLQIEQDTRRNTSTGTFSRLLASPSPADCAAQCLAKGAACQSWNWRTDYCQLRHDTPLNHFEAGSFSGVPGSWSKKEQCVTLNRPGVGPASGNVSMCIPADGTSFSFSTGSDFKDIWEQFSSTGKLNGIMDSGSYGAASVFATLEPGETKTLSIVLSWYFPARDYMNQFNGNYYTNIYSNSQEVAEQMCSGMMNELNAISDLHAVLFDSTLPEWLVDSLINSLSHVRSGWWTKDGRWRQWEAYDCVNVDSVHNDGERHIPYLMFFPNSTRNKMRAWGKVPAKNGMIQEQLMCGCMTNVDSHFDRGCGRQMSDVSSMFIVYLLELYKWANDTEILEELWPVAKNATLWQMSKSIEQGIPKNLCNTYDRLGPGRRDYVSYNAVFHLTAMSAAAHLAKAIGDDKFANNCTNALVRGQKALDTLQWVEADQTKEMAPHWSFANDDPASLMVDSLYGQVLAYTVGLGTVVSGNAKIKQHLQTELLWADSPYGLVVLTNKSIQRLPEIWQGGSPNWASLNIRNKFMSVTDALTQPAKSLGLWRSVINDQWNTCGIATRDGRSSVTSHYGFHMVAWHIPLTISGQDANLPEGELSFDPRVMTPYKLPVLLPGITGTLTGTSKSFSFTLIIGKLYLKRLAVGSSVYPKAVDIKAGQTITWNK